jgi:hypothetical protein
VGCSAASATALPAPGELAPDKVAVVAEVPAGRGTITLTEFRHGLELAAAAEGRQSVPAPGKNGYGKLKDSALFSMLETAWIYGQAAEWGISVTPGQVKRALTRIKRESFKSNAEYRRFLKQGHYTQRDIRERVEIQLLGTRLRERLQGQISRQTRTKSEEQRAFSRWVREFSERWRARTVCAPKYTTERCSNGPTVV